MDFFVFYMQKIHISLLFDLFCAIMKIKTIGKERGYVGEYLQFRAA